MQLIVMAAALILGHFTNSTAKQESYCSAPSCCTNQKELPLKQGNVITIAQSGSYALDNDIKANIVITANNVCLDLNGHTLTGLGTVSAPNAIAATGITGITIQNGTIKNPGFTAIAFDTSSQIKLQNLNIKPVEKAINIEKSTHICLEDIRVCGNSIASTGIINFSLVGFVSCKNVRVTHTIVKRSSSTPQGLFNTESSNNIVLKDCSISNNECQDRFKFQASFMSLCADVTIEDSHFNGNSVTYQGLSDGIVSTGFLKGKNISVKGSQFNGTTANESNIAFGLEDFNSTNIQIQCCEANDSTLNKATPSPSNNTTGAVGMVFNQSIELMLNNCKADHTTQIFTQSGAQLITDPKGFYLVGVNKAELNNCCAANTQILNGEARASYGFVAAGGCTDISFNHCKAEKIQSLPADKGQAYGFAAISGNSNISYNYCRSTHAKGSLTSAGFITEGSTISCTNCCATDNSGPTGYGFYLGGTSYGSLISDSYASHNSTAGFQVGGAASGNAINGKLIRNCAEKNGIGFLIEPNDGLIGAAPNSLLLLDNKAINNDTCGFQQTGFISGTTYINNQAQKNLTDFCDFTNLEGNKTVEGKLCCKD